MNWPTAASLVTCNEFRKAAIQISLRAKYSHRFVVPGPDRPLSPVSAAEVPL